MSLVAILVFSAVLRLWNLGSPKGFVFDEVYYVDGARDYLAHLVELDKNKAEFVVHPPLGKWLIALGIRIFGDHEFGWRFIAAVVGVGSIYLIYRIGLQLFKSEFLALSAALLMSLDGIHLVMSRTALLDIFLMFFILLSFYFLIMKHNWYLGIALAAACATKWSGLYYAIAFIAVALVREIKVTRRVSPIRALQFVLLPIATYLATWIGWFVTKTGWDRSWSTNPLLSLWHYHVEMLNFHTGLTEAHSYSANPWSWLILGRPTSFYYASPKCGVNDCSAEILALGTPFLWWSGVIALATLIGFVISRRDIKGGFILIGVAAGYLPWFAFQKRTVFSFYSIVFQPFLILAIIYCISLFIAAADPAKLKERYRWIYGYYLVIALCFLYFLPIFLGQTITYAQWHARMWFSSWI